MTMASRRSGDGIRTAKALLALIDEHSASDFEAAEEILSGQKEMTQLLRLLRELKDRNDALTEEPVTADTFPDIVRRELLGLPLTPDALGGVAIHTLGAPIRVPPSASAEDVVRQVLSFVDEHAAAPQQSTNELIWVLRASAHKAGPEHAARIEQVLRRLAIRALSENVVIFPDLHALAQLRRRWADHQLPYSPVESREHLAERLFKDAQRLAPDALPTITEELLNEGLRGPADHAIAMVRRTNAKKAKAHGK